MFNKGCIKKTFHLFLPLNPQSIKSDRSQRLPGGAILGCQIAGWLRSTRNYQTPFRGRWQKTKVPKGFNFAFFRRLVNGFSLEYIFQIVVTPNKLKLQP